ncbi:response regulator [Benzoatithermus flavus]|uniref:Response regulator n=1 Tax=Benzoatithermus flavus TaxID=3108223 RepID=A0ABU8XS93_9PROT
MRPGLAHVLIIEDDFLLALDLQEQMEELGFASFAFARDEAQAVAAARQQRPDLILADYRLASGTGLGAVRAIRAVWGRVPVVYVTGSPDLLVGEADPVVVKPFARNRLHRACAAVLLAPYDAVPADQ